MPVACYSACEIVWHRWEQSVVSVCGVVPIAAIMTVFPAGTYRHHRGIATATCGEHNETRAAARLACEPSVLVDAS